MLGGTEKAAGAGRLESLTSLRYFAALAVVVTHVCPYFLASRHQLAALEYGYAGVTFFFLLSGLVLTWSWARQPARRFWWNRFARVYPLQLVLMVAAYLLLWNRVRHPGHLGGWVLELLLLQSWAPDPNVRSGGDGPAWSLSCEFFFYAMFPLLVGGISRLRGRGVGIALAATVAALAVPPLAASAFHPSPATVEWLFFYLPGYRIGEFIIGMLLGRALRLGFAVRSPALAYLLALTGLAGWAWRLQVATIGNHGVGVGRPWVALTALPFLAALVVAAASSDLAGHVRLLGRRVLVRLGEWSFALYLVHDPLITVVSAHGWLADDRRPGGAGCLLEFLMIATALAALAHHCVEKPARRWLRGYRAKVPFRMREEWRLVGAASGARADRPGRLPARAEDNATASLDHS